MHVVGCLWACVLNSPDLDCSYLDLIMEHLRVLFTLHSDLSGFMMLPCGIIANATHGKQGGWFALDTLQNAPHWHGLTGSAWKISNLELPPPTPITSILSGGMSLQKNDNIKLTLVQTCLGIKERKEKKTL